MYNRYIPSADGTYRREPIITQERADTAAENESCGERKMPFPALPALDHNDLLVLAVIFLLLQNCDESERISVMVTLAAFLFLR